MSAVTKTKKGLKLGQFSKFVGSSEFIAVASAVILAPIFIRYIRPIISRIPFINSHPSLGLLAVSIILFIAAGFVGGMIKMILMGAAAGALLSAILSVPQIARTLSYLPSGAS